MLKVFRSIATQIHYQYWWSFDDITRWESKKIVLDGPRNQHLHMTNWQYLVFKITSQSLPVLLSKFEKNVREQDCYSYKTIILIICVADCLWIFSSLYAIANRCQLCSTVPISWSVATYQNLCTHVNDWLMGCVYCGFRLKIS